MPKVDPRQISIFDTDPKPVKVKYSWSIYAIHRYRDSEPHIETTLDAYSEKQARFVFYKLYGDYRITGIYRI